jgi:hypothetical protein
MLLRPTYIALVSVMSRHIYFPLSQHYSFLKVALNVLKCNDFSNFIETFRTNCLFYCIRCSFTCNFNFTL